MDSQAGRSLEQQLTTIESLAARQYPDDYQARQNYTVELLKQRLRELDYRLQRLPVKVMGRD